MSCQGAISIHRHASLACLKLSTGTLLESVGEVAPVSLLDGLLVSAFVNSKDAVVVHISAHYELGASLHAALVLTP